MLLDAWTTREKWIHRMILDVMDPVNYNNNVYKDAFLGNLYRMVRCCGANGPDDYPELFSISPPPQCIDTFRTGGLYFDEGCTKKFPWWLRLWSSIICGTLLLAALLSVGGIVLCTRLIKLWKLHPPSLDSREDKNVHHHHHGHHHQGRLEGRQDQPLILHDHQEHEKKPLPPTRTSSRSPLVQFQRGAYLAEHLDSKVTKPLVVAEKGTQSQLVSSVTTQTYESNPKVTNDKEPRVSEEMTHVFKCQQQPRVFNYEDAKPDRPFFSSVLSSPTSTTTSSSMSKYDSLGHRVYERIGGARVFHFPALLPRATMRRLEARSGPRNNSDTNTDPDLAVNNSKRSETINAARPAAARSRGTRHVRDGRHLFETAL